MPEHGVPETYAQARARRVSNALANPAVFGELYVRPYDPNWISPIPDFGREMLQFALSARRGVIILPPEFLKTTLVSQVLPLWLTYRETLFGRLLRGLLFSEEEGMAINNLSVVKWHIENNPGLLDDFSDDQGRPLIHPSVTENVWREDAITVARTGTSKEPTWQAKGLDSKGVQGRRLDWLIGDDVITPANAFSPARREKALRDWDMQFTTRLVKDGVALLAGNFNDPHDLVSTISRRSAYQTYRRPAIYHAEDPEKAVELGDPHAVSLWPENWPLERLRREQEEKPSRFKRIFMLSAASEHGENLKTSWVSLIRPEETPVRYSRFFISVDPAPGGSSDDLDFFNVSVGALHEGGLDLIESFSVRAETPRQVQLVGLFHDRFNRMGSGVIAVGIAKVALDRYFRGALIVARPDLEAKIVPISIPGSKQERLEALGPYAQTGWFRVHEPLWTALTSDPEDRWQEMSMHDEWRDFPLGRHDDRLDGADVLIRTAREFAIVGDIEVSLDAIGIG